MPPLSVFIIALNEADRIGRTIAAVRSLSDDIVLVDSGSTDGTQALAESLGARVIHHDWPGYGQQKRFAEEQCRHAWLLNIDADEVMIAATVFATATRTLARKARNTVTRSGYSRVDARALSAAPSPAAAAGIRRSAPPRCRGCRRPSGW